MNLLERRLTDITAGYDQICRAQSELLSRWRGPLLAAYARRMETYQQALAAHQRAMNRFRAASLTGIVLAGLAILLSAIACPAQIHFEEIFNWSLVCLVPISFLIGLGAVIILTRRLRDRKSQPAPTPPLHPLRDELIPPLLSQWRQELRGFLPEQPPDEEARGAYAFIDQLEKVKSHAHILHRLQQRPDETIDVIVAGRRGVWVFGVKHWGGKIIYKDGKWSHLRSVHEPGSEPVTREKEISQPPDQQWKRMVGDVAETLAPLVEQIPTLGEIKGGLVFSFENAERQIGPGTVSWGTIGFWEKQYRKAPLIPGLEERQVYQVLDALLERHRQVSQEAATRSMLAAADRLAAQAEKTLQDWINSAPGPT